MNIPQHAQGPRPKKSLGQNFLTSIPARIAIVEAGKLQENDTVFEIGPGRGFLTRALLDTGVHVVALEKDRELIPILSSQFAPEIEGGKFTLIEGDVLLFDITTCAPLHKNYKLIANIPYYITGAILSRYLSQTHQPESMVVLVQKEVAERIVARDGKESILSLSVKAYGIPKIVYRVNRGSFFPIPNVDSAVLAIENISHNNFDNTYHEDVFFKIMKAGFAHKRKLLLSNIKELFPDILWKGIFEELGIPEKARAEDLPLTEWLSIARSYINQSENRK